MISFETDENDGYCKVQSKPIKCYCEYIDDRHICELTKEHCSVKLCNTGIMYAVPTHGFEFETDAYELD
jgi:hypothetical protein